MLSRHLVLALAAAGAVGLPVLLSSGPQSPGEPQSTSSPTQAPSGKQADAGVRAAGSTAAGSQNTTPATKPPEKQAASGKAPAGGSVLLEEVFRPTITPDWVMQHWSRISTVTDQLRYGGYRVALVTGTRADDLTGSLTYYFDAQRRLRRIRFRGTTGNPDRLLALLQHTYRLRRVSAGSAAVQEYRRTWNGRVVSWVRVRPAAVIDARRPQERFQVELVLEPPRQPKWFAPAKLSPPELRL